MSERTVALTGATGFVGKATLERLLETGWQVRALTRRDQPKRSGVAWIDGALDRPDSLSSLCEGADTVLHIAGTVNARDAAGFEAGNAKGTANMLTAAKAAGVGRFVHVSSLSAREPQLSAYGASKAKAERLVIDSAFDWTVVRPPGVYGPGDTEVFEMFRMANRGFCLLPPAGRSSWIHVDDLARLLVALLPAQESAAAKTLEADDGEPGGWSHSSFARAIGASLGKRIIAIAAPRPLLFAAAWGDRLLRGDKAKLTADRAGYMSHPDWAIDRSNAPPAALWQPAIDTRDGLKETARWYKAQGWL
jgi:UDP-glucose 4-epimerase